MRIIWLAPRLRSPSTRNAIDSGCRVRASTSGSGQEAPTVRGLSCIADAASMGKVRNYYQRAAEFAQRHGDAVLVHALLRQAKPGITSGVLMHVWVELDDRHVYDPLIGEHMINIDEYRGRMRPVTEWRYNPEQAARLLAETGHFGPWVDL